MRWLVPFVMLAACAPVPVSPERAAEMCRKEVGLADGVQGNIGVGVGTGGGKARGSITVTDKVFRPQSADAAFAACVDRKVNGKPEPTTFGITIGAKT
ncbi:hypothetical protein BCF46_1621 [Litoreibacter meonggei]|uniref:Uncharacterized protein n=1 Tax=Litoreibacter meonggei TaxID=1049199 RepID=A0A497WS96_9RHOB|nr:hypothetical protein [Litoreibacter meonggei]RLJ59472.1 hypothetical protein BCF46_1621 [Litoreibacter meonggei]